MRVSSSSCTCFSRVDEDGKMGRQNFFMEPMAAGKAGAENSAATRLMRKIQDIISSSLLEGERERESEGWLQRMTENRTNTNRQLLTVHHHHHHHSPSMPFLHQLTLYETLLQDGPNVSGSLDGTVQ